MVFLSDEKKSAENAVEIADFRDIKQCLNGNSRAYERLVERHQDNVADILWRFTRDRCAHEELVQDVFVQAYLSLGSYAGKAPFGHWLARIATYTGYRYWKRNRRRVGQEQFSFAKWDELADKRSVEEIAPSEAAEVLYKLLARLEPRDRLVLTLHYLEGRSMEEISSRTGWSKTMVKVQCWRARNRLKKLFLQSGREVEL